MSGIKECCTKTENLVPEKLEEGVPDSVTMRRCKVCKCRHFEMDAAPGFIGLQGKEIGG